VRFEWLFVMSWVFRLFVRRLGWWLFSYMVSVVRLRLCGLELVDLVFGDVVGEVVFWVIVVLYFRCVIMILGML